MKRILLSGILVFTMVSAKAQDDELSGEIDKLGKGQIESKSSVPEDPTESAEEIENELNEEFGIAAPKKEKVQEEPVAPDELPEDVAGSQEELPVVEETKSASEQKKSSIDDEFDEVEETPKKAQEFKPVPPPPEQYEEPAEENYVEEAPIEPPAPIVEEEPVQEEPPQPVVEDQPRYQAPEPTYAENIPDDFEERMHRIYSRFYTEATSDTVWTQIAGEKINETYTVQPGDTLWDISVTFFGNGHYWPKVWQMNDNITNPHLVSPGYVLKFVPGQIGQAPQLNITNNETAPELPGTKEIGTKSEDPAVLNAEAEAVPVIPPPTKKSAPVLTNLPPSLPFIKGPESQGFDKDGFDIANQKPKIKDSKIYLASYLSEEKPFNVGKIIEMNEADDETATLYETVYLQMNNGATVGERLVVYSLGDKIKDTAGNMMGYPVIQEGEVQVQELVNGKEDVYKAIVTRSINNAKIGSFVARGELATGTTGYKSISAPVDAEVVGGILDNDRAFLGFQDIVYLNKGTTGGLKEGQVFTVLKSVRDRKKSTLVTELKEQIAKIKVVKTTPERATALVLESTQYVTSGDFIGAQAKLPTPQEIRENHKRSDEVEENPDVESEYEQETELE